MKKNIDTKYGQLLIMHKIKLDTLHIKNYGIIYYLA